MLPWPCVVDVEVTPAVKLEGCDDDEPVLKPQSTFRFEFAVFERSEELSNVALSLIAMMTVTMSPTLVMR